MKKPLALLSLFVFLSFPLLAENVPADPAQWIQKVENAYQAQVKDSTQEAAYKTILADLDGASFLGTPESLIVTPSNFDELKGSWNISLMSTDPILPFKGAVVYSAKDADLVVAGDSDLPGIPDLIADGLIKGRLVYKLAAAPKDKALEWSLYFVSVDLGYVEKGSFKVLSTQGLSATTYLTFTSSKRDRPQIAKTTVAALPAAKGKTPSNAVFVYGTTACGATVYFRNALTSKKIPFTFCDLNISSKNQEMWGKIYAAKGSNVGSVGLPVVDVGGTILIAPELDEVLAKLNNKPTPSVPAQPVKPQPTAPQVTAKGYESYMLAELNLARTNPKAYAEKRLAAEYDEGTDNGAYGELYYTKPVGKLVLNTKLNAAAAKFAKYLAQKNKFSHEADGRTPFQRMKAEGYTYSTAGENLACGSYPDQNAEKTAEKAAIAFVKQLIIDNGVPSLGHRKNILNGKFKEVGIGFGRNTSSQYQNYTVQDFGTSR